MATHATDTASAPGQSAPGPERASALIARTARQVRQFMCGLHGHDTLLHFDRRRVSLVCMTCGYESPGWTVPGAGAGPDRPEPQRRIAA